MNLLSGLMLSYSGSATVMAPQPNSLQPGDVVEIAEIFLSSPDV
jgi:hypothetical protein